MPVKKNDVILIAPWLLHRHEKLWRDPNAFIPSRFMAGTPPDRFAYLPFGVGARVCIGAHFALVEATLALARMIGAFRVELVDKEPVMPVGVVTTQPDRSPMFAITPPVTGKALRRRVERAAAQIGHSSMSDIQAQFSVLRQTADPAVVDAISRLIEKGEDHELNRINLLDLPAETGSTRNR